jgi:hypothetical protein
MPRRDSIDIGAGKGQDTILQLHEGPGATSCRFFMYEDLRPWWGKGSAIKIKRSVYMRLSG